MVSELSLVMQLVVYIAQGECPDFKIIHGLRTPEQQQDYVDQGVSWTLNSKHLTGDAIDFIPQPFKGWDDIDGFTEIGECFKSITPLVTWGGDWSQRDYGHIEIEGYK